MLIVRYEKRFVKDNLKKMRNNCALLDYEVRMKWFS